jgi:hypothetical protein
MFITERLFRVVATRLKTEGGGPVAPTVLVPEWKGPPEDMELPGADEQPPPPQPMSHADALSPAALAGAAPLLRLGASHYLGLGHLGRTPRGQPQALSIIPGSSGTVVDYSYASF